MDCKSSWISDVLDRHPLVKNIQNVIKFPRNILRGRHFPRFIMFPLPVVIFLSIYFHRVSFYVYYEFFKALQGYIITQRISDVSWIPSFWLPRYISFQEYYVATVKCWYNAENNTERCFLRNILFSHSKNNLILLGLLLDWMLFPK